MLFRFLSALLPLFIGGVVLWPARAGADLKNPEEARRALPAPIAHNTQTQAVRGRPVEIKLEGTTSTTRALKFILRRGPKLGTLDPKPLKMVGKSQEVWRYTPRAGETGAQDTFTFATQVEGSPASAEATVTITITDAAPIIEIPPSADAGRYLITEGRELEFSVKNSGNAAFRQTAPLPSGWEWLQPAGGQFDLAPGAETAAKLRVRTRTAGELNERVTLGGAVMRVSGRALPPFLAFPSEMRLPWDASSRQRSGRLKLQNNSTQELTVKIAAPEGVTVPLHLTLPALESREMVIAVSAAPDRPVAGEIPLSIEGHTQTVKVEAAVAPAVLVFEGMDGDGRVDFGILDAATLPKAERALMIKNTGGTEVTLSGENPQYFKITGFTSGMTLRPAAETVLKIAPVKNMPGVLREEWKVRFAGGEQVLRLEAEVDVAAVNGPVRPALLSRTEDVPASTQVTPEQKARVTAIYTQGVMEEDPRTDPALPRVETVRLVEEEPDRVVFQWNPPGPGQWTYEVVVAQLRVLPGNPYPVKEFGHMDNVKVTWKENVGRAEATGLTPGGMFKCRIIAVNPEGRISQPSRELTFITPYGKQFSWGWTALWTFTGISLVVWWRARRREKKELWRR